MQFGLFIGAAAIVLMAWSFVLAVRLSLLEPLFGGLDSMYRVHRWAGSLSVVAMFLHTQAEPEIDNGVRGASKSMADAAEELAGAGELMLYGLIVASLLRWMPYRWWRWTHKVIGIPFAFACFHFFTAEKTYANGSPWGLYFGAVMAAGLIAYVVRVLARDVIARGKPHSVTSATVASSTLELELTPDGEPLDFKAGQFAVLKVQRPGLTEPHIFTIAAAPTERVLRFYIRDLGDWTAALLAADLENANVLVEGPYGRFEPLRSDRPRTVWVAGGVGITPFLSAIAALPPTSHAPPILFYCVRSADDAMAIDALRAAHDAQQIRLVVCSSSDGQRFSPQLLADYTQGSSLADAHVAVCGPAGLVALVREAAARAGADHVEHEDFDIRQGFGPDLSRPIAAAVAKRRDVASPARVADSGGR